MASGSYQLIWVAGSTSGGSAVSLSQLAQGGAVTGQAILWNGSAWAPGTVSGSGGGTLNSISGDVTTGTVDGSGNAVATVQKVGSYTAGDVVNAVATVASASPTALIGTLAKRDSSGNATFNVITGSLTGNATNITGNLALSQLSPGSATSGQALLFNGTAWAPGTVSGGGGTITALTGDVSASGTGSVAATVNSVGGSSASAVNTATTTVAAATNANTASTLVMRDASKNFSANVITASLNGNATTATTASSATSYTGTVTLNQLAQTSATSNQAILWNGTAWAPGTVSTNAITALTGDVSASGSGSVAATVNSVGGSSASAVNSAVTTVGAATNANTASTLVMRDASKNFSAGTITAALNGNATTATTASSATSYTGTVALSQLAQTSATSGQAILWNGTAWAPGTVSGGGSGITALTGDVTASGTGSVVATVASVGGSTASAVNTAAVAVSNASATNVVSVLALRDANGGIGRANRVSLMSGATLTPTGADSGTLYIAYTSTNTLTLPTNPSGVSYRFEVMGAGGTMSVSPPATGTAPAFYYHASSTTSAVSYVNTNSSNYIEFIGIPGTSSYYLNNLQGNWQSAGNPIGVYSALSYPSTSGYVLTANGSAGGASFQAPASASGPPTITAATATPAATDTGKWYYATSTFTTTLPVSPSTTTVYTFYCEASGVLTIAQGTGAQIWLDGVATTSGTSGSLVLKAQGSLVTLTCRAGQNTWYASGPVGGITIY